MNYERRSESRTPLKVSIGALVVAVAITPLMGKVAEMGFDEEDAVRVVEDAGYIEPEIVDKDIFLVNLRGCSRTDNLSYEVDARSLATDREVSLLVCDGILKGATVRNQ